MPRAMWSGAISFGLVSIPVKLYTAISTKSVRFNQIDSRTGSRVKQKRVSAADGSEVSYDDIVKGYEVMKDTYITVTDEEIESLSPKASRSIDILEFVEEDEIDPLYYQNAYYLVPDELARKSYALLAEAMEADGRVALAKFVMRTKEYLAAVRPLDGKLVMSTMVYSDEVVATDEIPGFEELGDIDVSDAEKMMATQLIESLAGAFDPAKYEDTYREKVLALIEQKSSGELTTVSAPEPAESAGVIDLLAALEASVAAAKESRGRHPTAGEGADADEVEADAEEAEEAEEAELVSIGVKKSGRKKVAAKKAPAKRATKKAPAKRATAKKKPAKKATAKKAAKKSA